VPFEDIACPGPIEPPKDQCTFPLRGEPLIGYYWDETCVNGKLGCWADGMHAECRFCGSGVFQEIPCPNSTAAQASADASGVTGADGAATSAKKYDAATASQIYMRKTSLAAVAQGASSSAGTSVDESDEQPTVLNGAASVTLGSLATLSMLGLLCAS